MSEREQAMSARSFVLRRIRRGVHLGNKAFASSEGKALLISCHSGAGVEKGDMLTVRQASHHTLRLRARGHIVNSLRTRRTALCCVIILLLYPIFPAASGAQMAAKKRAAAKTQAGGEAAVLFSRNCAGCHGSDGRGGERAPNIATDPQVVGISDAQLNDIVSNGMLSAGMPAFNSLGGDKVKALVGYLRVLQGAGSGQQVQLPGDPQVGEKIFFGVADCGSCHMMNGRGGFLGEDLTEYARGRSAEAVRASIVHPGDSPEGTGHVVTIETAAGTIVEGLIRAQDNFTIVVQSEDGAYHSVERAKIRQMTASPAPLMPQDYGKRLDDRQLNALVSYLLKSAGTGRPKPVDKDDDEE